MIAALAASFVDVMTGAQRFPRSIRRGSRSRLPSLASREASDGRGAWFSSFFEKAFVKRVTLLIDIRIYFVIFVTFVVKDVFVAFVVELRWTETERWPSTQ